MTIGLYNLLERLSKADVDFVIIGGFAGVIHGCTVVTQDLDICCDFVAENLLRLQAAIADLNPVHRMTPQKIKLDLNEQNCQGLKNLYLDTDLGQLDCVSYVAGVGSYEQVKTASRIIRIDGSNYRILNLKNLIESKKAMGRPHDREAVIQLEAIEKKQNGEQR